MILIEVQKPWCGINYLKISSTNLPKNTKNCW